MNRILTCCCLLLLLSACDKPPIDNPTPITNNEVQPWDQWAEKNPTWVEPFEPFRVLGNIYYVGTKGIAAYLITTSDGHIVLDGGLPQNAPQIAESIADLGFHLEDVKILLNSHAHFDHSGGLAELKRRSGAQLLASAGDRAALEGGFTLGDEDDIDMSAPPVPVDKIVEDGEVVTLGDVAITARLTPGHTRGCTSWEMTTTVDGTDYAVLFFGGATVAGNRLHPPQYDGIVQDFRETFAMTSSWGPDVFLSNHPFFFEMEEKRARQKAGDNLAFVDTDGFPVLIEQFSKAFEEKLEEALAK